MTTARLASKLWRRVHPDLFARWPTARAANERSMQNLRALLDVAEDERAQARPPPPQQLRFYVVHDEEAAEPLREIAALWRSPTSQQGDAWQRSADGVLAALLRQTDPAAIGEGSAAGRSSAAEARNAAADDGMVRAAAAAAERRRRSAATSATPASSTSASEAHRRRGGALRTELIFFHGVDDSEHARATARLSDVVRDAIGADESHGPILVCGGAPPAHAAAKGFACIGLDATSDQLRASLDAVSVSVAGVDAATRRADGDEVVRTSRALSRTLGCEQVRLAGGVETVEAAETGRAMLDDAFALRAALDAPWRGLFVDLLPMRPPRAHYDGINYAEGGSATDGAADANANLSPIIELVDAACGGGALRVRGVGGALAAVDHVRREWRVMRAVQERFYLATELRERLGCRAVHCFGAPARAEAQCAALRQLLRRLRERPVLLGDGLLHHALHLGCPADGAPAVDEIEISEHAYRQSASQLAAARGRGLPALRQVSVPDDFAPAELLEVLQDVAAHAVHPAPKGRLPHRLDFESHLEEMKRAAEHAEMGLVLPRAPVAVHGGGRHARARRRRRG